MVNTKPKKKRKGYNGTFYVKSREMRFVEEEKEGRQEGAQ